MKNLTTIKQARLVDATENLNDLCILSLQQDKQSTALAKTKGSAFQRTTVTVIVGDSGFEVQADGRYLPTVATAAEFAGEYGAYLEATLTDEILATVEFNEAGERMWGSAEATKNIWAYAGSIGRTIEAGVKMNFPDGELYEKMFLNPDWKGAIPSKGKIEALAKDWKPIMETFGTLCDNMKTFAKKKMDKALTPAEITEAQSLVSEILTAMGGLEAKA